MGANYGEKRTAFRFLHVCLLRISQKPDVRTSANLWCVLPVAVARSSFGSVDYYVLPVGGSIAEWLACWTQAQ